MVLESSSFKMKETQIALATFLIRVSYCIVKTKLQVGYINQNLVLAVANYVVI